MLYPLVFIGLCYFFLMPVCDSDIERPDIISITAEIMNNPYSKLYPSLFPYCKLLLVVCLVAGICGFNLIFSVISVLMTAVIAIFEAMGDSEEWEFVWLVSNSVAVLFISGYFIYELIVGQNELTRDHLHKSRLWLVPLIILSVWCPVQCDKTQCVWDFSLDSFIHNYAATSFSYVGPSLLAVLLLFYPYVNRQLVGILTAICSLYGLFCVGVDIWNHWIPQAITHLPLLIVSAYGYYLYFSPAEVNQKEKEKEE